MYEQIPDELRNLKRWGLFRKEWKESRKKYTKIPVNPYDGTGGKSNDENTWSDFETALEALGQWQTCGLAFYFKEPYLGIDIDHVSAEIEQYLQGDTENIVYDFLSRTNSYTETSISGEGVHIITRGAIPGDKRRHKNVEMYQSGRFFALTGNAFGKPDQRIDDVDPQNIKFLYKKYIDPQSKKIVQLKQPEAEPRFNDMTEQSIVDAALASKSGTRFERLMKGVFDDYESQSEADLALANMLAFWTAKDFQKMDTIFRESGLMRDKYDQKHGKTTYGSALLNKAIADASEVYHPRHNDDFFLSVPGLTVDKPGDDKKSDKWYSYDDTGLAERFMAKYGSIARYDTTNRKYMYFDGIKWNVDNDFTVEHMLNDVVAHIKDEPLHVTDDMDEDAAQEAFAKFNKRSRNNAGKTAAMNEIRKLIPAVPDDFDTQLNVLNTPSGYTDLANGDIHETNSENMFAKVTKAEYSPTASAPMWQAFLDDIFLGDKDMIHFIQKAVGYSLLGTVEQAIVMILHGVGDAGNGSNGKSVFMEALRYALGDYAVTISPDTLMAKKYGMDNLALTDLANMKGARMVITSETESGVRLSEATVKRLTGGEPINAKRMYAEPFSFLPTGVVWMTTNNKPIVRGTDNGIWRRLVFVPFEAKITGDKVDVKLGDKLKTEAAGILNWAIEGALEYQTDRKLMQNAPEKVTKTHNEYRSEMDTVQGFLDDVAEFGPGYSCTTKEINLAYNDWNKINQTGMTNNRLSRELGNKFKRVRTTTERKYIGFRIKPEKAQFNQIYDF